MLGTTLHIGLTFEELSMSFSLNNETYCKQAKFRISGTLSFSLSLICVLISCFKLQWFGYACDLLISRDTVVKKNCPAYVWIFHASFDQIFLL